ncbi:MAG: hypothetical protein WAW90_00915 [Minisyncoccia bacterium]
MTPGTLIAIQIKRTAVPEESAGLGFLIEAQATSGGQPSRIAGSWETSFGDSPFGMYVVAEHESDGYREFYLGPTWKPILGLTIGAGVGFEHVPNENPADTERYNVFVSLDTDRVSAYSSIEYGVKTSWYVTTVMHHTSDALNIGLMAEQYRGEGFRIEALLGKLTIWGAALYSRDTNSPTFVSAMSFQF